MKVRYLLVMQCRCMSVQACANVRASRQACAGMDMSVCVCTRARVNVHDTYRHASAPSARRCHGTRCLLCACRQKPHNCCLRLRHGQHGSLVACDSGSAAISLRKSTIFRCQQSNRFMSLFHLPPPRILATHKTFQGVFRSAPLYLLGRGDAASRPRATP